MSKIDLIPVQEFDDHEWSCSPCAQEGQEKDAVVVLSQLYVPFTGLCAEHASSVETPYEVTR